MTGVAAASTLSLDSAAGFPIQHTENSPCIISSVNCPNQPSGFDYTDYAHGGVTDIDQDSPVYTAEEIYNTIGGYNLGVGIDVSQTNANSPQTLDLFEMYYDDLSGGGYTLLEWYDRIESGDGTGNVAFQNNNGSGYADWTLTGFLSLVGLNMDGLIYFRAVMSDLNDGPEQFFIYNTEAPPVVPLPAAAWLLISAIGGMGVVARRRRAA